MEKVNNFLESDQMVFLLLGDSGAGKSTFNRELECHLWRSYKKTGAIPLYINLPAIEKPEHDMIAKQLRRADFTEPQIRELKLHRRFTLICDGYDESQQIHNLYTSNRLNEPGEWNAKMVISCRSEYLGVDYRDRFQPGDRNNHSEPDLLQEAVITPFSMNQVQDYITQYISVHRPLWKADEYRRALDLIPSLKELVKNPFLMSLSLEVLPRMVDPGQDLSATHITRMALYDQFIEHWLERGKKRLGEKDLSPQAKAAFENLIDEGFTRNGIDYLKKLSVAIYKEQDGQPIVSYSRYKDENSWKAEFFSREEEKQLMREACPLIRNGNQYRFIHRSLLEYGVALAIFDPRDIKDKASPESSSARRMSLSSVTSFERDSEERKSITIEHGPDPDSPLSWRSFVNEPSVIQFLEERVQQEPLFKQQLLDYIEQSKNDKKWRTAASNAITILVRAGMQFIGADLRGIRVPNADLSYGVFDSAQLQGADLRQVDFHGAWLRRADLSHAQMAGVQFGELPFLNQDIGVELCAYSPDGKTIASGLCNFDIAIYSTLNCESLWTLEGHWDTLMKIVYSPDSNQITSCGNDGTVQLWDVLTGTCLHVLKGHHGPVTDVAYSLRGDYVASASYDMTVKVWDVVTGECHHILIGHTDYVFGVKYSPKGDHLASNSQDRTVRLWDIETQQCLHILRGHEDYVRSIAYSSQGDQLASASNDMTVRLWNVATGDCHYILTGHTSHVYSAMFSPNSGKVASASDDKSVRLWDVNTGTCLHTLLGHNGNAAVKMAYSPREDLVAFTSSDKAIWLWDAETGICRQTFTGHSGHISCIVFSPEGDQVASSSFDTRVRLWFVGTRTYRDVSNGHDHMVRMVILSPRGDQVATCSDDKTARLWDVKTGTCRQILRGHSETVHGIAYPPQGDWIATCSGDSTIKLWSTETGECIHTLTGHKGYVGYVAYSPNGGQLASGGYDGAVRLWDVKSGECRHTLNDLDGNIRGGMYSPNGNLIASFSDDSTVWIWDVETGVCNALTGHSGRIREIVFSSQGDQVVSVSEDTTVRVWDAGTGVCCHILIGHNTAVVCIAYSPKGNQIVSGGTNGSLKVWNLEGEACLWTLTGHRRFISGIVYSLRGDLIAAASFQSVRLWDATSGQSRAVIESFHGIVFEIAWTEDAGANYLVTGCSDGLVGMWRVLVDKEQCRVSLHWTTTKGELNVLDATIEEAQGMSQLNKQLLKQRGAVGEPGHRLREANKTLGTMTSVASRLKTPLAIIEDPTLPSNAVKEQVDELIKRVKDPKLRDILSVCFKDIHEYM